MRTSATPLSVGWVLGALALGIFAAAAIGGPSPARAGQPGMTAFTSDAALADFIRKHVAGQRVPEPAPPPLPTVAPSVASSPAASPAAAPAATAGFSELVVTGSKVAATDAANSITNNQVAGVDEGDIIKARGDTLVILRRGRLFTVSVGPGGLRSIDSIDAYPPGVDAGGDWYDEMLVSADQVVVIGYSYERSGTQIDRFRLSPDGRLTFKDAYQLRSNDYYSDSNYASRLVGHRLVFYTPLALGWTEDDPLSGLPALRKWAGQSGDEGFRRIAGSSQIYLPAMLRDRDDVDVGTLHTVTTCDLTAATLNCEATGVFGSDARTFYVSQTAVYVWVADIAEAPGPNAPARSLLYRLPLDGSRPQALAVLGAPADQFSFDEEDGVLNVLLRSESGGDAMWRPGFSEGDVALMRVPLSAFGDGSRAAPRDAYRLLPKPPQDMDQDFHNRFVGDYVLYGLGAGWNGGDSGRRTWLVAAPVRDGAPTALRLGFGADRIEAMGRDAVVVGSDQHDLYIGAVELTGGAPRTGDRFVEPAATQGETRSHGFFFRPDGGPEAGDPGIIGLPVARPGRPAFEQLFENSAGLIYVRRAGRRFAGLGELDARLRGIVDDDCVASCVDWYGNARPIFLGRRVFALLGYELVEGAIGPRGIHEVARVSFAPRPKPSGRQ